MRILITFAFCSLLVFGGFAQERYENERYRFSIVSPPGFEIIKDYQPAIPVVFLSAPEDGNDNFRENINVAIEPFNGNSEDYFNSNVELMGANMNEFKYIESSKVIMNGQNAIRLVYSFNYENIQTMKNVVYLLSLKGWGYAVTCSMLVETFERYEKKLSSIAETLQLEVR